MRVSLRAVFATVFLGASAVGYAQNIISAHSGTLHYSQGEVMIDGKALDARPALFPDLKVGAELRTGLGRAEVLLVPGVFLRLGEETAVKMVDKRLADTRVELVSGTVMVE